MALKLINNNLVHKTEVGAVVLGLMDAEAVHTAVVDMKASVALQASVPRYFAISQPTQKNHPKQALSSSESSWNMPIQLYEVDTISNSRNANDYEKVTYP